WVRGNRHHLTRHQRSSRCRTHADRIEHRNQMDQVRRERDAAWHRNIRNGRERDGLVEDPEQSEEPGQGEESGQVEEPGQVEETGQGDETGYGGEPGHAEDPEQLGQGDEPGQVEEPELLERLLQVSDDDAPAHALIASEIIRDRDQDPWEFPVEYADFQWDDLDLGGQNNVEEAPPVETAVEDTSRNDATDDKPITNRHPGEGVTECRICLCPFDDDDTDIWVCRSDRCRQPYHRTCIIQSMEHDPRCGNCRTLVELDVEDGEAIIVKHVPPPPKCRVCGDATTGFVLEGPQYDHQFDYRCLVDYNAQFYGLTALGELKCPAYEFPFPVDDFYDSESGDNSGDDVIVDNAFENEGDEQDLGENGPDHNAEEVVMISDGEYHEIDFNSEEDGSDDDYTPGEE
ncbi:hypothetical protein F442_16994, partial [Phytophthora nicotianae P10297]